MFQWLLVFLMKISTVGNTVVGFFAFSFFFGAYAFFRPPNMQTDISSYW